MARHEPAEEPEGVEDEVEGVQKPVLKNIVSLHVSGLYVIEGVHTETCMFSSLYHFVFGLMLFVLVCCVLIVLVRGGTGTCERQEGLQHVADCRFDNEINDLWQTSEFTKHCGFVFRR